MATTDIYHVSGGLTGRKSVAWISVVGDDYIQVDAAAVARVAANDTVGSWTAWVNIGNITGTFTIIGAGDDNLVEFIELNIEAGLLTGRCTDGATPQWVTQADGDKLKPHRWYHVAITQAADGHGPRLYINGVQIAATNDTTTDVETWFADTDAIDTMRIGAANKVGNASVTNEMIGAISDVKIFTDVLTDAEVLNDFNGIVNTDNLHNHWDFDDDLIDAGTGADDGTNVGGAILLVNNYSEFSSRLRLLTGAPAVADTLQVAIDSNNNVGHAVVIQAA